MFAFIPERLVHGIYFLQLSKHFSPDAESLIDLFNVVCQGKFIHRITEVTKSRIAPRKNHSDIQSPRQTPPSPHRHLLAALSDRFEKLWKVIINSCWNKS